MQEKNIAVINNDDVGLEEFNANNSRIHNTEQTSFTNTPLLFNKKASFQTQKSLIKKMPRSASSRLNELGFAFTSLGLLVAAAGLIVLIAIAITAAPGVGMGLLGSWALGVVCVGVGMLMAGFTCLLFSEGLDAPQRNQSAHTSK